ncbi:MAG TPA: DUF4157 domain-containing protein [Gaiellaceae bacterium]|nr:DUF4157 domain-containing protein [Gaiellaceae bacterium]
MTAPVAVEAAKPSAPAPALSTDVGTALPAGVRSAAESARGVELGSVRLRGAGPLSRLVHAHGADAGASGDEVAFARGLPDLGTPAGRFAVGHELAHVAQQRALPAAAAGPAADELEERADAVGRSLSGLGGASGRRVRPTALAGAPVQFGAFETVGSGARAVHDFVSPALDPFLQGTAGIGAFVSEVGLGAPAVVATYVSNLGPRLLRLLLDPGQVAADAGQWQVELVDLLLHWRGAGALWAHLVDGVLGGIANVGEFAIHALEVFGVGELLSFLWGASGRLRGIRPLTSAQIAASQEVHPPGLIPYWAIRVDHDSLIARLSALFSGHGTVWDQVFGAGAQFRAVTTMHMIHVGAAMDEPLAVHELTHVAQYELVGAMYMPQALHAQLTIGNAAYDYDLNPYGSLADAAAAGATFAEFNREQQAQICEDFYKAKHGLGTQGGSLPDLEYFVNDFWGRAMVPGLRQLVPQ